MLKEINVAYDDVGGPVFLSLPTIGVTPKDGFILRKVTGLSAPDVDLFIGRYARDGGTYHGRRVGERNVVLTIDLNPNPALGQTASGLRKKLYGAFLEPKLSGDNVDIILQEDDETLVLTGFVESFEADFFEQENMVQISLICPDPYIKSFAPTVLTNPGGYWVDVPVIYKGNASTGFDAKVVFSAQSDWMTLDNNGSLMRINYPFLEGDSVFINTSPGLRDVYHMRGSVKTSLLSKRTTTSAWVEIRPISNRIRLYGFNDQYNIGGIESFKYVDRYWGI